MSRPPLKAVAGLVFVLTLSCAVPALAQERILVIARSNFFGDTIFEVDTAEASFGAIRRVVQVPSDYLGLTRLAGGRVLILKTPRGLALFDPDVRSRHICARQRNGQFSGGAACPGF